MAHILVHQQQTHRSSNISIHPSTSSSSSSQKESKLSMTHSVDERLFLPDSSQIIHLLTRFASEPHISKYQTQSTNSHGYFSKSSGVFTLSKPVSNSFGQVTKPENEEIYLEDIFYLNCDKIQPVSTSLIDDLNSDKTDNITTTIVLNQSSEQRITTNDEVKNQQVDDDSLFDTSPSINNNDLHCERHFRRRKRRSSLTKTPLSIDDTQSTVNLLEKLDINQQQSQEIYGNLEVKANDNTQDTNVIETKIPKNGESNETVVDDEKPAPVSRYRGRSRLEDILSYNLLYSPRTKTSILSSRSFDIITTGGSFEYFTAILST